MDRRKIKTLRDKLRKEKNKIGLAGTDLQVAEIPGDKMKACIHQDWGRIEINYGSEMELVPDNETKRFVNHNDIEDPEEKVGMDVLVHEAGHRENPAYSKLGCPHTIEMHDALKETIFNVLQRNGKEGQVDYITNAFEDILDNVNSRNNTDFLGQTLFWNNQGTTGPGKFNKLYEAFVRTNLFLGGDVRSHTLLSRFFTDSKDVKTAYQGFLEDFKTMTGAQGILRFNERPQFDRLYTTDLKEREKLWTGLAESFARNFVGLIEEQEPNEEMFGSGENPFDKEMKTPQGRQKIAKSRYEAGKGPSAQRDLQEQLYDLYRSISKEIRVETTNFTSAQSMPLVHFGSRFANENDQKIRFRGIGFNSDGELGIKTARHSIDFPVAYKKKPSKFPSLKIALMDRSESMSWGVEDEEDSGDTKFIPWGDKSRYHFALKGYFGIENYLENQGIAPYVESCALGWSGEEKLRGNYKEVAKSLLTMPSGGTRFDLDGLEKELNKEALVLSISDGDCFSGDYEDEDWRIRFEQKLKECDFAHIQIGVPTGFSKYLQSQGVLVKYVKGDEDLSNTMIDFVSGYYKSFGQEGGNN